MPDDALLHRESPSCDREEYLSAAIDNIIEGIIIINEDRIVEMFNPAAERIFGYAAAEVVGRNIKMLMPEPFHSNHDNFVQNYLRTGVRKVIGIGREVMARRQDGSIFPIYLAVSEMRPGQQRRFVGVIRDISDIRQAQGALRESEERFRTMADSAPVLIWMAGVDARCEYFNKSWLDFTGRSLEQEQGMGWEEGVHPEDAPYYLETYLAAFKTLQPFEMEYRLRRADGAYRWMLDNGTPRFNQTGTFIGYIGSCIDITDRRRIESALRELSIFQQAILDSANYTDFALTYNKI